MVRELARIVPTKIGPFYCIFFCSCVCFSSKFVFNMKRAQYFFSFALATISFIAARSIQKEGIQNYFEQVAAGASKVPAVGSSTGKATVSGVGVGKLAANWVINELAGRLNREGKDISASPVSAEQLGAILDLVAAGTISGKIAKDLFEVVWMEGGDPRAIVEARGMKQVTDVGAIEKVVDEIIAANADKAVQAREKPALLGWFVGQVMKSSGGKASPQAVNDLLKKKLGL